MKDVLWLASGSPRRRDLLTWAGFQLEARPSDADERYEQGTPPIEHALALARRKGAHAPPDRVVLSADTLVHVEGRLLEKPEDFEQAQAHLRTLSGRWHQVTTGVFVRGNGQQRLFSVTTGVRFRALDDHEISAYIATGEPMDKAGAYGIQGRGGTFVAQVEGSWTNVMGLPIEESIEALRDCGMRPWT